MYHFMNKRLLEMKYMRHHGVFLVFLLLVLVSVALEASTVQLHIDVGLNHFYRRRYFEASVSSRLLPKRIPETPKRITILAGCTGFKVF